jgi:hypothetical protein
MLGAALACASFAARAQSAPPSVARSLGIFVYPSSGQTSQQQVLDEGECFAWAQQQTGANPLAPAARPEPSAAAKPSDSSDAAAKGAVTSAAGGAVAGTAIGAVAGDTGKGCRDRRDGRPPEGRAAPPSS